MKKILTVALAAAVGFGVLACKPANAADWSYVGGGYSVSDVKSNIDNRDVSADAWYGEASVAVTDNFFVQGGYTKGMDQDFNSGVASLAVGLNTALDERTDLYGKVTASTIVENRRDSEKYGYAAEVGVRANLTERFELRGGAIATNLRERRFESVKYFGTIGAEYALTPSLRLGADVRGKSNVWEGNVGLRAYF